MRRGGRFMIERMQIPWRAGRGAPSLAGDIKGRGRSVAVFLMRGKTEGLIIRLNPRFTAAPANAGSPAPFVTTAGGLPNDLYFVARITPAGIVCNGGEFLRLALGY